MEDPTTHRCDSGERTLTVDLDNEEGVESTALPATRPSYVLGTEAASMNEIKPKLPPPPTPRDENKEK